jgi:threonine synthase
VKVSSTRSATEVSLTFAIETGLAADGGLYMPPRLPPREFSAAPGDLRARATELLSPLFADEPIDVRGAIEDAFTFDAPTKWLKPDTGLLELFHGPTAAFKDFGARFFAACLSQLRKPGAQLKTILVATSGDTGAAVASAFHRRDGFRVVILYPDGRVSPRQAHQLGAFGENVRTFRVQGSFDDCQRMVKEAFALPEVRAAHALSSANSISLGRLLPQMAYYAHASLSCVAAGKGRPSFVIPTGNLGNAFACLLAREYGLPIDRVRLATNANRVLPEMLASGQYQPRKSVQTLANAMDVGAPSNVERLLHRFPKVGEVVSADWVDDDTISDTIRRAPEPICPHTACGLEVLRRMRSRGEAGTWIVAATAHPAKFESIVEPLIGRKVEVPPALAELLARPSGAEPLTPDVHALVRAMGA